MQTPEHRYYHKSEVDFFKLVIPPGQSILFISRDNGEALKYLSPQRVVIAVPDACALPDTEYECHRGFELGEIEGNFDYIILHHTLTLCDDIGKLILRLSKLCKTNTRILICTHNYFWKPMLWCAEKLNLKRPGGNRILLSATDMNNIFLSAGFQLVNTRRTMLCPIFAFGLGPVINLLGKFVPFLDLLKVNVFQIYRPLIPQPNAKNESLTICLTCRDERDNIEPLVKVIPVLADEQEILFVEGHSADGTRDEIQRVKQLYPEKNIRLISQPGKGQGDAIREGFSKARGRIIILLEADMTSPPENIQYFYESLKHRHAEFLEGSRFIYPISSQAMPYLNQIGNWMFAFFFSWLFWRQITDVLSGIKAIRKADFDKILARWDSWGLNDPFGDFELLFGAMRLGLKTGELPIHYHPRVYGDSKTRFFYHGYLLTKMAFYAFLRFRG